jgi:hypothetical protein
VNSKEKEGMTSEISLSKDLIHMKACNNRRVSVLKLYLFVLVCLPIELHWNFRLCRLFFFSKFELPNRQYSYSPTALGREPSEHECEANAGNFARNYKETYGKLRLGYRKTLKLINALRI